MLKLQYFGHLMQRADSLENTLMLGRLRSGVKWASVDEMVGWHQQFNQYKFKQLQETVKDREDWHDEVYEVTKTWTPLSNIVC